MPGPEGRAGCHPGPGRQGRTGPQARNSRGTRVSLSRGHGYAPRHDGGAWRVGTGVHAPHAPESETRKVPGAHAGHRGGRRHQRGDHQARCVRRGQCLCRRKRGVRQERPRGAGRLAARCRRGGVAEGGVPMKLFIDTANVEEIRKVSALGILDGVTTNPTLLAKEGRNPNDVAREILALVPGPVSLEVTALDAEGMVSQGKELATLASNVVVKIPMGAEGLRATKRLSDADIAVNMTLVFSANHGPPHTDLGLELLKKDGKTLKPANVNI